VAPIEPQVHGRDLKVGSGGVLGAHTFAGSPAGHLLHIQRDLPFFSSRSASCQNRVGASAAVTGRRRVDPAVDGAVLAGLVSSGSAVTGAGTGAANASAASVSHTT